MQTANARAAEIQARIDEETARVNHLVGQKKEAARQCANGGSPVVLNKVQGEITQQQGLIEGLEETLDMVNEVAAEKKQALATAESALEAAHCEYWREAEKHILSTEYENCKRVLIMAWRAVRASGQYVHFNDYTEQFFKAVIASEALDYPIEIGKVPERSPKSNFLSYQDRGHV